MSIDLSPAPSKRFSLPGVEEFSSQLRTMFINIGFFTATILLIPAVGVQLTRTAVVIDPIAVPPALEKQGLTPEVVANRLWDGLQAFAQSASEARESVVAIPDSQLVEFSLPDAGISIDSIFTQIRQFFGAYDTRLAGEVLCATSACEREGLRLRLRVVRNDSHVVDLDEIGDLREGEKDSDERERNYYREAAAGIYEIIDPYVAIAALAERNPVRSAALARRLIAGGTRDAKWAHNLVGDIERRAGDFDRAADDYRAALALDENFHAARAGLAQALAEAGNSDGAREILAGLEARDPRNRLALPILADLAAREDNLDEAIRLLRLATERDPTNPAHLATAGNLLFAADQRDGALSLFAEALEIDPSYGPALTRKTQIELEAGNFDAADASYRRYLDFVPDDIEALLALANLRFGMERFASAIETYNEVLALRPGDAVAQLYRGAALLRLGQSEPAIVSLEAATAASSENATAFQLLGAAYRNVGRLDEALTAYRRALELDPAGPGSAKVLISIEELEAGLAATPAP